jgi:hypothetical protein
MKMKTNHIGIIKQSLGWLAVFAGAGLAVGAMTYQALEQKIERSEQYAELTEHMVRAARLDALLRQLGEGRADMAKEQLSSELAYNVTEVKSLAGSAEGWAKQQADQLVAQVARDERKHPDYYLASTRLGTFNSGRVVQMVRH